ncbi:sigma-70 family RNA polymerase sigma factor [Mycobacterium sp. PS03-16]|uniref:sigma-70 family RNA polymerase sigma factor n=1 Tax=Mycobacterium sp. PS03-16 TaxID=2559611 RepID=UPI001072F7F4|nr:sigma-70 family RNA polymerase sigma factor [Mycobacterium sp. PS03-16]TFV61488.1 sigma-70 family RNA polymerase sigma factor [Mycobacterium sp. PS03-16]
MTSTTVHPISLPDLTEREFNDLTGRFERDVAPLRAELVRAARRLTVRDADAEDLVQDVMLRAYRSFATFDDGSNVRGWMYQILRNTWVSNYRAAQRRVAEVPTDEIGDQVGGACEAAFLDFEPDSEVYAAMAALREEFRMVVYLADVEGYPYAEVAAMMGTPVGTVMSRLHRARRQLRVALGGTVRRRRLVAAA